ncbi:hypothetical protein IPJ91_00260 [bacterium]|nr:MAG: hypothetical protein IPJ91_00260 [bacterium]
MAPITSKDRGSYTPNKQQIVNVNFPSFLAPNALTTVASVLLKIGYPDVSQFVNEIAGLNPAKSCLPRQYDVVDKVEKIHLSRHYVEFNKQDIEKVIYTFLQTQES